MITIWICLTEGGNIQQSTMDCTTFAPSEPLIAYQQQFLFIWVQCEIKEDSSNCDARLTVNVNRKVWTSNKNSLFDWKINSIRMNWWHQDKSRFLDWRIGICKSKNEGYETQIHDCQPQFYWLFRQMKKANKPTIQKHWKRRLC